MTMQLVQHVELTGNATSITISNIPQDADDLLLKYSVRTDRGGAQLDKIRFSFNGPTNSWGMRQLIGFGSGGGYSEGGSDSYLITYAGTSTTATANTFGNAEIYIPGYRSGLAKIAMCDGVTETNASNSWQMINSGVSNVTAAITSIVINKEFGANFVAGSSVTLYRITRGSSNGVTVS